MPREDMGPRFRCGTPQSVFYSRLGVMAKVRRHRRHFQKPSANGVVKTQQRKPQLSEDDLLVEIAKLQAELAKLEKAQ